MQPSIGAKRMVGASGASLTVVAKLDTVDAILGMDFLKAYDVTINLKEMTSLA